MKIRPVLLTRPAGQIGDTTALLRRHGFEVIALPLTEIAPPSRPPSRADQAFARAARWLIFTSRNAVQGASRWLEPDPGRAVIAIGAATARAAEAAGWRVAYTPPGQNSEALLQDPGAPGLHGRICIVGGSGGRRQLKAELSQRGCEVRKLIVYRRVGRSPDPAVLRDVLAREPLLLMTSGHAMRQWRRLCQGPGLRKGLDLPLLVASRRLCKLARPLGFSQPPRVLPQMSDAALLNALTESNP